MAPDKPEEKAFRWRREDAYLTVTGEAFAKLVHENGLEVKGPFGGYLYAMKSTTEGQELYRTFVDWTGVPLSFGATADPAAGANPATITVPAGKRWLLVQAYVLVVCSGDVANRTLLMRVTDSTNTYRLYRVIPFLTAGTTSAHTFGPGLSPNTTLGTYNQATLDVPGVEIPAGHVVGVEIIGIQAADNAGPVYYAYKEVDV